VLGNRPGVLTVEANPVAQIATVCFDPSETSVEDLRAWVEECAGTTAPGALAIALAWAVALGLGVLFLLGRLVAIERRP